MISNIATAIMSKFNEVTAGAALRTILTGGLWFMEAKDEVTFPYGVFAWNGSNIDEIAGDRTNGIETASITVSLFSKNDDGGVEAFSALQAFISLYDWSDLTFPSGEYTKLAMQRTSASNRGKIDNIWQLDLDYNLWYQH
jgi:hypothetical protein